MWRMDAAVMESAREQDTRRMERNMAVLARAGVTSVHHNNSWHQIVLFRRLHAEGKLTVRIYAATALPAWRRLRDFVAAHGRGDAWLHWAGLKGYGAISEERYYPMVSGAAREGFQVMVHVGSPEELHALLSVFERVRRERDLSDPRFRVEHAHDMPADAIPRMVKAGAIASWQPPLLAHFDRRTAAGVPPPLNLFPCRDLLEQGVRIAFGTDTMPWKGYVTPLQALRMALERPGPGGSKITLDEALAAFTRDAAYAEFAEKEKGTLEPGKLADFVLLDRDLEALPVHRFGDAKVMMTVVGGRAVFE
jgi:predicted amidohydrolase YtcJ